MDENDFDTWQSDQAVESKGTRTAKINTCSFSAWVLISDYSYSRRGGTELIYSRGGGTELISYYSHSRGGGTERPPVTITCDSTR